MAPKNTLQKEADKISITDSIAKTGYVLEHKVATMLENEKWAVIHNRYYLDDVTEIQREMDMIAYKVDDIGENVRIFTALIISCKKSSEHDWVFLTRNAPSMNININMLPVSFFSNLDIFNFQFENIDWSKEKFIKSYDSDNLIDKMYNYNRIVFAYQEIRKTNNAPNNDTNIYLSIASLIKAQSYEIASLRKGRKGDKKYVYNLNLISVADTDFYELHYQDDTVKELQIDRINYLNRFLISNQEQHSKIDILQIGALPHAIEEYNELHKWNINFYKTLNDEFYEGIFNDYRKKELILSKVRKDFIWHLNYYYYPEQIEEKIDSLFLDMDDDVLVIRVSDSKSVTDELNSDKKIIDHTKDWLKKNFRYAGEFYFSDDLLPF